MTQLALTPYEYIQGDLIQVRTSAINEFGSSLVSEKNTVGASLRAIPHQMIPVARDPETRADLLKVSWTALSTEESGDSNILSYKVVWDAGSGSVNQELTSVTTYYTDLTYEIIDNIVTG